MDDLHRIRLPVLFPSPVRHGFFLWFLVFCFLAGTLIGSLVKTFHPMQMDVFSITESMEPGAFGYLRNLFTVSWPSLFVLFFASSAVGFLLIPPLFVLRGYMMSASACVLLTSDAMGLLPMILILGVPALFSTAALFLLGEDAFSSSFSLYRICAGFPRGRYSFVSSGRLMLAAVLLTTAAVTQQLMIPLLLYK